MQDESAGPLSPLVRKMAREYNIDLKQVRGTGAGGRITKQDLENYLYGMEVIDFLIDHPSLKLPPEQFVGPETEFVA